VPGDPGQVVYVWWDALTNYVTALGRGADYERWWAGPAERVHVIGKGIVRFHAVYWLALLLSAGLPLPTAVFVHDYLTVDGAKLSKSAGNAVDPADLVARYGVDAVRWWFLREVARVGDTDFTVARLVHRADTDLANGLGNLVNRTLTLVHKYRAGRVPAAALIPAVAKACAELPARIDRALADFDLRAATGALWSLVDEGNRLVEAQRPWELARSGEAAAAARLDAVLATLVAACRVVATELQPFLPASARRLLDQLSSGDHVGHPRPAFPRLKR
jgi:methionyl-tRNA synthetase